LNELFERQNTSPRKDATSIPATFLRVGAAVDAHLGIDVQMGLIGMEARLCSAIIR
jgi:hypothetical protein